MTQNAPYLGLRPFKENEQDKFFGRLQEIHILTDKILAHRLTLLVAASGVGKSSLLQAGVMPALRATGMADLIYHNDWVLNPAEALKKTIVKHFIAHQRVNADYQADFNLPLVEFLQIHALLGSGTMVILLDQFEEFFYYQKFSQQRDEFIRQLASAIHDSDTPTAFVFSMREDFAMEMEAFKPWFVGIFNNIYRIEKLDLDAARLAIVEPVKAAGLTYQPELIELLLTDLGKRERIERIDLQHIDEQDLIKPLVEPPYLQIVCEQLWLKANASTEREITKDHYQSLGGADGILKRHFDEKMVMLNLGQQRLASKAFDLLVSQHGTKMSYPLKDLASILAEDAQTLQFCLDQLQSAAILRRVQRRGEPWYELYHDAFAKTIMEWNLAYKRRQLIKTLIIRGGAVVLAGLLLWAADDVRKNYYARHFRLGKESISERVELYQGQSGSQDILTQQKFVYESDFQRTDIEADKRFETAEIADLKQTAAMQMGQLPLAERFAGYAQAGLLVNADKVFVAISKAKDKKLPSELPNQISFARVESTINRLQKLKDSNDSQVREAAIKALGRLKAQATIKSLLPLLEDKDVDVRRAAIDALGRLNAQAAIKSLLPLLEDKDVDVRRAAIEALGRLNAQAPIKSLLPLLEDKDVDVRRAAIEALGDLNAQAAIKPLLALLDDADPRVGLAAIEALGYLNAQAAIKPLLALLKDSDSLVLEEAIALLKQLEVLMVDDESEAPSTINELIAKLKKTYIWEQQGAAFALSKLPQPPAELAEWQNQQITELKLALKDATASKARIASHLGYVHIAEAVELLGLLLKDEDIAVVRNAIISLGKISETHNQWIQAYSQQFIEFSQTPYLQKTAIKALGQTIGSQSGSVAQQYLLKIASDLGQTDDLRLASVDALGNTAQPEIAALLFNLLQNKSQTTLHFTITYWLAKMPYPADKKVVILDSLKQRLSDLEKDKASWREQRDAYQEPKTDDGKPIVCFGKENTKADKTTWCDDYQVFQYAYAIARVDPQNAGIELLKHPLYQARQAAIRALAEKANGELLQNLFDYYQAFNWQDLPSPRPYATYRAIDKVLQQLETSGTENDLKILQALKAKLIIPAKSQNPSDMEQQQDAMIQRFDWTIKELDYRLKNNNVNK